MTPSTDKLLSVTVSSDGKAEVTCNIPKLEAVKFLLGLIEELRFQAFQEQGRLIEVPPLRFAQSSKQ